MPPRAIATASAAPKFLDEVVGKEVEIQFAVEGGDDAFFRGTIEGIQKMRRKLSSGWKDVEHYILFDDGDERWFDLSSEDQYGRLRWITAATTATISTRRQTRQSRRNQKPVEVIELDDDDDDDDDVAVSNEATNGQDDRKPAAVSNKQKPSRTESSSPEPDGPPSSASSSVVEVVVGNSASVGVDKNGQKQTEVQYTSKRPRTETFGAQPDAPFPSIASASRASTPSDISEFGQGIDISDDSKLVGAEEEEDRKQPAAVPPASKKRHRMERATPDEPLSSASNSRASTPDVFQSTTVALINPPKDQVAKTAQKPVTTRGKAPPRGLQLKLQRQQAAKAPISVAVVTPAKEKHKTSHSILPSKPFAVIEPAAKRKKPATTNPRKPKNTASSKRKQPPSSSSAALATTTTKADYIYSDEIDLRDFEYWLRNLHKSGRKNAEKKLISKANANCVMRQVRKFVAGEGVTYGRWPNGTYFKPGVKFNLRHNYMLFHEEAKAFEDRYGEDLGHGWLMRHPIMKLKLYCPYARELRQRKREFLAFLCSTLRSESPSSVANGVGDVLKTIFSFVVREKVYVTA
ncbi:expressed unknown protein [Seminavis robusta]|uniref:Uncharacterized protein n=1 Tax=Seminavis robusta TaxID=568900 RepID=A0A9N8E813_9STRA|nr:expressed unknown protein [Seminavis robusta]|eukprot:Sro720_g192640.1 n/a (576) ;mRNA; f:33612-35339